MGSVLAEPFSNCGGRCVTPTSGHALVSVLHGPQAAVTAPGLCSSPSSTSSATSPCLGAVPAAQQPFPVPRPPLSLSLCLSVSLAVPPSAFTQHRLHSAHRFRPWLYQPLLPEARGLQQLRCSPSCLLLGCSRRSRKATALCKPTRYLRALRAAGRNGEAWAVTWGQAEGTHPGSPSRVGQRWGAEILKKQRTQVLQWLPPGWAPCSSLSGTAGSCSAAVSASRSRPSSATHELHCHVPLHNPSTAVRGGGAMRHGGAPSRRGAHLGTRGSGGARQWTALGQPWQQMSSAPSPHSAHSSSSSCRGQASRGSPSAAGCRQAAGRLATCYPVTSRPITDTIP